MLFRGGRRDALLFIVPVLLGGEADDCDPILGFDSCVGVSCRFCCCGGGITSAMGALICPKEYDTVEKMSYSRGAAAVEDRLDIEAVLCIVQK